MILMYLGVEDIILANQSENNSNLIQRRVDLDCLQDYRKIDNIRLSQYCYIMTVSVLLEQPNCNKSDSPVKLLTSC